MEGLAIRQNKLIERHHHLQEQTIKRTVQTCRALVESAAFARCTRPGPTLDRFRRPRRRYGTPEL